MPNDLWERCAGVVSRVESRLKSALDRDIFQSAGEDLTESLAPITAAIISYAPSSDTPNSDTTADTATQPAASEADLSVREAVGEDGELLIQIWYTDVDGLAATERQAIEETATAVCALFVGAMSRIRLRETQQELQAVSVLAANLFDADDPSKQFHRIAVELARILEVDRLSLLQRDASGYQFVASSVQSNFDPRAQRVLQTRAVAAALEMESHEFTDSDPLELCRGEADERVDAFLASGDCQSLTATVLASGTGMAIGETFNASSDGRPAERQQIEIPRLQRVLIEAATVDAMRCQPRSIGQRMRSAFSSLSNRWRLVAVLGLSAVLMLWPMTIRIAADGHIVPRSQYVVYAPVTGQIERVECESGTHVVVDQVLCEFSSHDLDLDISRLHGEILTVREQLQIAAARRGDESAKEVSSDRRVLEIRLSELEKQLDLLTQRQAGLVIRSPIAGVVSMVIPDDLGSLTAGRPIQLGQSVIRVIDLDAGYRVELDVPDDEMGYVVTAMGRAEQHPVHCRFRFRSQPEMERTGVMTQLQATATTNQLGQLVVVGLVEPTEQEGEFAAESGVVGWIDCDRASVGFVLCRKVIERFRNWGWL